MVNWFLTEMPETQNEARMISSVNGSVRIGRLCEKLNEILIIHYMWTWNKNRVKCAIIELLDETIGKNDLVLVWTSVYLDMITKAQITKTKIDKCNYIILKSSCIANTIISRAETELVQWERIFTTLDLIRR